MEDERDWGPKPFRFLNAWTLHPYFKSFVDKIWKETLVDGWAGFQCLRKLKSLRIALKQWNQEVFGNVDYNLKLLEEEYSDPDFPSIGHYKELHILDLAAEERPLFEAELNRRREAKEEAWKLSTMVEWVCRPSLSGPFKSIRGDEVRAALEAEFLESEVIAAVKTCDGNKAPSPDRFNLMLFQKCWQSIKGDVMQFMSEFHQNSKLVHGINSSFVALIPKNDNPSCLGEYRPISLIGSLYKVLAKVLSNRIKHIMPRIISESQSAFIGGRSILDGVLIANEIVDGWKKNKRKDIVLKLDFEKACDSINWEFLFSMLANFGFGSKWIKWMQECVSSAKISIVVNGSPTSEFSPQRGLRQGDPLSPFQFNIVAEGLNILMTRARLMGLIKGAVVGSNDLSITHLQFADDTIIFCEAEREEVLTVKRILRCFEIVSGLKINYYKSVVCGIGLSDELSKEYVSMLNCFHQSLPLNYLGMPLGDNPRRRRTWKPIIDKVNQKLASWKRRFLSFASRMTMIKSVLSSLPTYYLSLFKMPEGVAKEIDKIQSRFLWGGDALRRKIHLVKWGEVTQSKSTGGLGIRKVRLMNACLLLKWWWRFGSCLLLKWWWRFGSDTDALWKQVICSKYGEVEGGWWPLPIEGPRLSLVWRYIQGIAAYWPQLVEFFKNNIFLIVGNGRNIKFWLHNWVGNVCLKDEFPRLYFVSLDKDESVEMWELEELKRLRIILLNAPSIRDGMVDRLKWNAENSRVFTVAFAYKWSAASVEASTNLVGCIWKNLAPPKVQFFGWLAWKERIKTASYLQRLGVLTATSDINCIFCKDKVEDINHWWTGLKLKKKELPIWKAIPLAVFWSIWKQRNESIFKGLQVNFEGLCDSIKAAVATGIAVLSSCCYCWNGVAMLLKGYYNWVCIWVIISVSASAPLQWCMVCTQPSLHCWAAVATGGQKTCFSVAEQIQAQTQIWVDASVLAGRVWWGYAAGKQRAV
ncbi:uncharacterized protein LOC114301812 [Camellia sinensis]|uniref:uncharacterized protein LOC114301812 n=1 Tax=Camellia sinensis TaxID=4442 RepID=UPI0010367A93|nr:uncharacterized protein LOC114301812 [Camellia sinensis]